LRQLDAVRIGDVKHQASAGRQMPAAAGQTLPQVVGRKQVL
jgi:hypothetical protein